MTRQRSLFQDDPGSLIFLASLMILITSALTLSYLGRLFSIKELFMLGPLLAWALTPVFWIYMSDKLRDLMWELLTTS